MSVLSAAEVLSLWVSPSGRGTVRVMRFRWAEEAARQVTGDQGKVEVLTSWRVISWLK